MKIIKRSGQAKDRQTDREILISWCFEPSQPQRITSGLEKERERERERERALVHGHVYLIVLTG